MDTGRVLGHRHQARDEITTSLLRTSVAHARVGNDDGGGLSLCTQTQEAWERFMCGCCGPDSGVSWVQEQVNKAFTSEKFVIGILGCVSCKFSHFRQKKEKSENAAGKAACKFACYMWEGYRPARTRFTPISAAAARSALDPLHERKASFERRRALALDNQPSRVGVGQPRLSHQALEDAPRVGRAQPAPVGVCHRSSRLGPRLACSAR